MRPDRPIGFDAKVEMLNGLGEFSLASPERFTWVTRHAGVAVQVEGGACIPPVAYATNPYSAIELHWKMITEGCPIILIERINNNFANMFWAGHRFIEIGL